MRSRGGYVETLMDIFPNIGLDPRRFCSSKSPLPIALLILFQSPRVNIILDPNFTVVQNRRKLFDNYAKEHSFNPLVEQNWYAVDMKDLLNAKVCYIYYLSNYLLSIIYLRRFLFFSYIIIFCY